MSAPASAAIYTPAHAARLLRMDHKRVRRWLGTSRFGPPPVVAGRGGDPLVSFHDLIELMMIRDLLGRGLTLRAVRQAVSEASSRTGVAHPLASGLLHADGRSLFLRVGDRDEHILTLGAGGQLNLEEIVGRRMEQLEFDDQQMAVRWWPRGRHGGITVDPRHGFGDSVVEGTGVSTEVLFDAWRAEGDVARVAALYRVGVDQVQRAIEFERSLAA